MSVLIRNGGGSTRVKVDGIPPTERLNLSKIGGEKLIEIGIQLDEDVYHIQSNLWKRKNEYVFIGHSTSLNQLALFIINKDGSTNKTVSIFTHINNKYDVCTLKDDIYILEYANNGGTSLFKLNDIDNSLTLVCSLPYHESLSSASFCGIKNNKIYITSQGRDGVRIYMYDVNTNDITQAYKFNNDYIDFMYLINNDFYMKDGDFLKKISDNSVEITTLCRISGILIEINNELYEFKNVSPSFSDGRVAYQISKFNFNGYFETIYDKKEFRLQDKKLTILLPKAKEFTYVGENKFIKRYVKELYLTEKREE